MSFCEVREVKSVEKLKLRYIQGWMESLLSQLSLEETGCLKLP